LYGGNEVQSDPSHASLRIDGNRSTNSGVATLATKYPRLATQFLADPYRAK
jgi:hypothetical protein